MKKIAYSNVKRAQKKGIGNLGGVSPIE